MKVDFVNGVKLVGLIKRSTLYAKFAMGQVRIFYLELMQLLINVTHAEAQEFVRPVMGKVGLTIDYQTPANYKLGIAV